MKRILCFLSLFACPLLSEAQETGTTIDQATDTVQKSAALPNTTKNPQWLVNTIITNTLDGSFAGLQATSTNGQPGVGPQLLLRGFASSSGVTDPMILLNGIPYYGDIAAISVQDVDSVVLLRTALETLPYGSRGANGVINIMTKQGNSAHDARLNIDARFGLVTRGIPDYDVLDNEKDFLETTYQLLKSATNTPADAIGNILGGYNPYNMPYSSLFTAEGKIKPEASLLYHDDWRKALQRIAMKHDYHLSVNGKGKKGNYYIGAGYLKEQGYIRGTDLERFSTTLNGEYKILPWLKAGANTNAAMTKSNDLPSNYNGINVARYMAPIFPVYYRNTAGEKETDPVTGQDKYDWGTNSTSARPFAYNYNPAGSLNLDQYTNKNYSLILQPYLEATLLNQFIIRSALQYNISNDRYNEFHHPDYGSARNVGGRKINVNTNNTIYTFNQSITWKPEYGQNHHISITAMHENFRTSSLTDHSSITNLQSDPNIIESTGKSKDVHQYESYRAIAGYDFRSRYFISGGFNRDQSSLLSPSTRWKNNWTAGIGYMLSEENFLKGSTVVNKLKFRTGYGTQNYIENDRISLPGDLYKQWNGGIDFSGLNNRLQLRLDVYNRKHDELLYMRPNPAGTLDEYYMTIRNRGIEMSITGIIVQKAFSWTATLNLAHNKNVITSITGSDTAFYMGAFLQGTGNPLYTFFLPEYAGVDPETGRALYTIFDNSGNKKQVFDYDSAYFFIENRIKGGNISPKAFGSLTQTFAYKNFELSLRLNFALGGKVYDNIYASLMGSDNGWRGENWSPDILNYWTPENRNTDVPALGVNNQRGPSTRFLTDASYLNIKNIYLGYTIPSGKIKQLKSLSIYLTADNIWLFSARKGLDPQANLSGTGESTYPPARTIMLGMHVGL